MIYVDDQFYGEDYFANCYESFRQHPILSQCARHRVAVCVPDPALWVALCLYMRDAGGVVFPLPVDTPIEGAERRAASSGCEILLIGAEGDASFRVIRISDPRDPGLPSLIQTSSGTTGEPKFIERTWASIDVEVDSYIEHLPEARSWTPIVACPITHSYGLISGVLVALRRGACPVIIRNKNPKYILRKMREADEALLYSSPALISAVATLVRKEEPLFAVMTSGTGLSLATFDNLRGKVRHLLQQYGCSEAGCVTLGQEVCSPNDVGEPLPHVQVTAGTSSGSAAEILLTLGSGHVVGTRDLGYFESGRLHFVSRLDDMINVAGLNVYPSEVEEVVLQMSGITDAVVFKKSRALSGDQVCLHFVAEREVPEERIRQWCEKRLASHQVPLSITQVPAISRLPNGKVSRKALAEVTSPRVSSELGA